MQAAPKVEKVQKTGTAVAVRRIFSMKVKTPSQRRNEAKKLEADRQTIERNGHPGHQLEAEVDAGNL
jgi:hypothetical protein